MDTATQVTPVSATRWAEAQEGERVWWRRYSRTPIVKQLHELYAAELQITETAGRSILDVGGGPKPLAVALGLPFASLTVVDPLATFLHPHAMANVSYATVAAEQYAGPQVDEAWGYNVLQHVIDPERVIAVAKQHSRRVRWFDWVDTPIAPHHPHSLSADWIVGQFADWVVVSEKRGHVDAYAQSYVALIAERP